MAGGLMEKEVLKQNKKTYKKPLTERNKNVIISKFPRERKHYDLTQQA
jgi:hypothetical protein